MKNALTVDLEDWYHPELVRRRAPADPEPQVVEATDAILRLLDRHRVRATFFVLGEVARRHPDLIRDLHVRGHEIASHGMTHRPLWELGRDDLDRELRDFREVIRGVLGEDARISGYRAPTFSMDHRTRWAMPCLADHGYLYDSSVFPVRNYVYGVADAPCAVYRPDPEDLRRSGDLSGLLEFPMTVFRWGRLRLPVGGGFYLRALPYPITKFLLRRVNRERPFVAYFHPWETHAGTPRVPGIGLRGRLITYYGLTGALRKVERLLRDFEFEPMIDVLHRVTRTADAAGD